MEIVIERALFFVNRKIELKEIPGDRLAYIGSNSTSLKWMINPNHPFQTTPFEPVEAFMMMGWNINLKVNTKRLLREMMTYQILFIKFLSDTNITESIRRLVERAYLNSWEAYRLILKFVREEREERLRKGDFFCRFS
jgi:hypothetical protein